MERQRDYAGPLSEWRIQGDVRVRKAMASIKRGHLGQANGHELSSDNAPQHLLPNWAPKRYVIHAVYPSKRGLLPSVRALLDYLGARFSELRED